MIPNPDLDFRNSAPKIHFWANLCRKRQSCPFCLKIDTPGILEKLIPILNLYFRNSEFFGQIWVEKIKIVSFVWKLTHMVSWKSWFQIRGRFSKFWTQNPFLDKFGAKKGSPFILLDILPLHLWAVLKVQSTYISILS